MKAYLEHLNISVTNLDASLKFFQTAFPDFYERGRGSRQGSTWVHFGDEESYVALNDRAKGQQAEGRSYDTVGMNHAGFVVEDATALAERLKAAGYQRSYPRQEQEFRIREYFLDTDGNEYEFVEYLSEKPEERNSYAD